MKLASVYYKCRCMKAERSVAMEARTDGETMEAFMHRMQLAIYVDHKMISPACEATTMEYAKLGISKEGIPGGAL